METDEKSILSRYLCPNLCQVGIYQDTRCKKCGEEMEYIGDYNDHDLDVELGRRSMEKLNLTK